MTEAAVIRIVLRSIVLVVVVSALLWLAWTVRSVLVLLLVSMIMAAGLSPVVDAISGCNPRRRRFRLPRAAAALLLYAGLFLTAGIAIAEIVPRLVEQAEDIARKAPAFAGTLQEQLRNLESAYPSLEGLDEWLSLQVGDALAGIGDVPDQVSRVLRVAMGVVNGVFTTLLLLVFTFYLIIDGEILSRGALGLLPPDRRQTAAAVAERVKVKIGNWLIGQIFLSVTIGITTFIGLRIVGVPYALFLAVVAAIGELIPMVGPIIAGVPAVIVALQISPAVALVTVGLYVLIQQLENHILVPQVMRRAVDLPPVVVMAALLMGNEILGVVGAIIALPVAAAASVVVGELLALRDRQAEDLRVLERIRE